MSTEIAQVAIPEQPKPLEPRITKSTAVASIKQRFATTAELLKRFVIANKQAGLWDGERDGIREAVKTIPAGTYENVVLSKSTTEPVCYVNAEGKYQLEETLQTGIMAPEPGTEGFVLAFFTEDSSLTPAKFLDTILHKMQTSKEAALSYMTDNFVGFGAIVNNENLYEKKGSEKNTITLVPPNTNGS